MNERCPMYDFTDLEHEDQEDGGVLDVNVTKLEGAQVYDFSHLEND